MSGNRLKLNTDKTELLWVEPRYIVFTSMIFVCQNYIVGQLVMTQS